MSIVFTSLQHPFLFMKLASWLAATFLLPVCVFAQLPIHQIRIISPKGELHAEPQFVLLDSTARRQRLDTLPEVRYWLRCIRNNDDVLIVTVANTRKVVGKVDREYWQSIGASGQKAFRDSLRTEYSLPVNTQFSFTSGKRSYYPVYRVMPYISKGIRVFAQNNTDPWYAQAILLIESPAGLAYSSVGAYGPFQLMPEVAREMGLKVAGKVDERAEFDKSAMAAAKLIRTVCIPQAREILNSHRIAYNENDLWFRLFVMHVYHAGAGNVRAVVGKIRPKTGGMALIQAMWHTRAAEFGQQSQNYSQIALAALIELDIIIQNYWEVVQDNP